MRTAIISIVLTCIFAGCDLADSSTPSLSASFSLTDTAGHLSTVFHSGDDFLVTFIIRNTTEQALTFYRGDASPSVIFSIMQNESVIATSIDGYAFIQVPSIGRLDPSNTLQGAWRAPTTPAQFPKIVLSPGSYRVEVSYPHFVEAEIKQVAALGFTII